jgi:hypothetical protein
VFSHIFRCQTAKKLRFLLFFYTIFDDFFDLLVIRAQKAAKSPFFVARDRREREFACILAVFMVKYQGGEGSMD